MKYLHIITMTKQDATYIPEDASGDSLGACVANEEVSILKHLPEGLSLAAYNEALRAITDWERTGEYDWVLACDLFNIFKRDIENLS